MIETGKYSTFKGPISNRDYHDAASISQYFIANEFDFFLHTCVSIVTQVRRNINSRKGEKSQEKIEQRQNVDC